MGGDKWLTAVLAFICLFSIPVIAFLFPSMVAFFFPYPPVEVPAVEETGWTLEGLKEVVEANNRFAFKLYFELAKFEAGNVFFSPYSVFSAFAMVYEGAEGVTAEEIRGVFSYPEKEVLRPNFAVVYDKVNRVGAGYELRVGNALWVQEGYPFLEGYLKAVEKYYGGKAAVLDFIRAAEESRKVINGFIEEQTNGRIKDLIPPGSLDEFTRLVLTNAVYFKGYWKYTFDESLTREEDFWVSAGNRVKVRMMRLIPNETMNFNYADVGDVQVLELPYSGENLSMIIIVPKSFETLPTLSLEEFEEIKARMKMEEFNEICMPEFAIEAKYSLKRVLSSMGVRTAFTEEADFSGMSSVRGLSVSDVVHQACVKVDEKGSEAAAATAVVVGVTAVREKKVFRVDRPFVFVIQDRETGLVLFVGRVVDPTRRAAGG